MAAQQYGLSRIAKTLNEEGLPCPRPQQGRPAGWAPSSIHALLRRDVYRGVVVWNKTRKRDAWGVKHQQSRPERDWLRVEVPELAIIDEALWTAAQSAMSQQRARFSGERRFRSPGRPSGTDGADTLPSCQARRPIDSEDAAACRASAHPSRAKTANR
jgi:hypothetical protein